MRECCLNRFSIFESDFVFKCNDLTSVFVVFIFIFTNIFKGDTYVLIMQWYCLTFQIANHGFQWL